MKRKEEIIELSTVTPRLPTTSSSLQHVSVVDLPCADDDAASLCPQKQHVEEKVRVSVQNLCIALLIHFTTALQATVLLPFVGLYVVNLAHAPRHQAGYYAAVIVALYFIGNAPASFAWGSLSDINGRRPALLFGLLFSGVAIFLFGLCASFPQAAFASVIFGISNGNAALVKSFVAEGVFVSDKQHQRSDGGRCTHRQPHENKIISNNGCGSQSSMPANQNRVGRSASTYGVLSVAWAVGSLAGPLVGGSLYGHKLKHQLVLTRAHFENYHSETPVLGSMASVMNDDTATLQWSWSSCAFIQNNPAVLPCTFVALVTLFVLILSFFLLPKTSAIASAPKGHGKDSDEVVLQKRRTTLRKITLMSMLISGANLAFGEVLALQIINPPSHGGIGLGAFDVGLIFFIKALIAVCSNLYFDRFVLFFGPIRLWRIATVSYALSILGFGFIGKMSPHNQHEGNDSASELMFSVIAALSVVRVSTAAWSFSLISMFVVTLTPPRALGRTMGFVQGYGAVARVIVPLIASPMFAVSVRQAGHAHPEVCFIFLALFAALACAISFTLPSEDITCLDSNSTAHR